MGGFMGWFLTFLLVLAIFNAEKIPELRALLEEKIKDSVDAAKEGSKIASDKIKQVKNDIENKKNAAAVPEEAEENTPEEIDQELQVMAKYVPSATEPDNASENPATESALGSILEQYVPDEETQAPQAETASEDDEDKPIDLENRY